MPSDTIDNPVAGHSNKLQSLGKGILYTIGIIVVGGGVGAGVAHLTTRDLNARVELERKISALWETSLKEYGDNNSDNIITRAERDEFQLNFAKRYGLTFVSGFPYRYEDGRSVPDEELIKMLSSYIGTLPR